MKQWPFKLTQNDSNIIIYSFAFAIGFSTTMAEPSLTAIARKAKEISDGKINDFVLRLFVALGVAIGISLWGAFRIVNGGEIVYYIMAGYMFVIVLTFMAPKYIVPIAYDSGGVTTSTVTVPLVAALGLGLATKHTWPRSINRRIWSDCFCFTFPYAYGYGVWSYYRENGY